MAYANLKHNSRCFHNCILIIACLILVVLCVTVAVGLRIETAEFPELLGNIDENVARVKATAEPNEFTFLVIGDVKGGTATFEAMLDIIHPDKPAFAVILGDFVGHSEFISHKLFALEMAEHAQDFPIFIIPGNHDISTDGSFGLEDFENTYGPAQFYFTVGKCLFVFINDISPYGQTKQYLRFLEQILVSQAEKTEKTFVFMHIPPSGLNSSLMCNELPGSEKFLQLSQKYHIDYVFAGDHHGYVKTQKDKTTFIVTGGGGARLRGRHGKFYHLVRIGIKDAAITETIVASRKKLETAELIERNIAFYFWPLITRNSISIVITILLFGLSLLIFSASCKKILKKRG